MLAVVVVGGTAAAVHLGVLLLLGQLISLSLANPIAFLAASVAGYLGHALLTFLETCSPHDAICACEAGMAGLVLGGSHHKTGTVLMGQVLRVAAQRLDALLAAESSPRGRGSPRGR